MIESDNTVEAEGLGSFFINLGRISAKADKKLATNVVRILLLQPQLKTQTQL